MEAVEYKGISNLVSAALKSSSVRHFVLVSSAFVLRPSEFTHIMRNRSFNNVLKWKLKVTALAMPALLPESHHIDPVLITY